jgi:D-alanyl-D-alanine carboxypeptidase
MTAPKVPPRLTRPAPDHRSSRPRVLALLLVVAVATGLATTVVSAAPALPACKVADVLTKFGYYGHWNRSLVDSYYRLSSLYKPGDLRNTSLAGLNSGFYVRSHVISDLKSMAYAARVAGARLSVQSAFRSYTTQKATFDYWVRVHGYSVALLESARAGHSEHQLGTTLDFKSYGGKAPWDYTDWGTTAAGKWLKANAWKYGFVMSYPKGKTAVTCYTYEPWHYRYVGRAQAAALRASGQTFREYLWIYNSPSATPTPTPTAPPSASPSSAPSASPSASPPAP